MHAVPRSPEPESLAELRRAFAQWDDLGGQDRRRIRDRLARDFRQTCAYCERRCQQTTHNENLPDEETIDHFRPRDHFPSLSFDWLNLVYACRRCNQAKRNSWPGYGNSITEALFPASEYVNPNATDNQRPAQEFFSFDFSAGEIIPSNQLDSDESAIAGRTIRDINLNDIDLADNDPSSLLNMRKYRLYLTIEALMSAREDISSTNQIISRSISPGSPFSSYIAAYVNSPLFSP